MVRRLMEIPKSAIISKEKSAELLRTAKEHVRVVEEGHALHLVKQDGVIYVVNEMTMEEAKKIHGHRDA